jgi:hypothetical protein
VPGEPEFNKTQAPSVYFGWIGEISENISNQPIIPILIFGRLFYNTNLREIGSEIFMFYVIYK